MFTKLSPSFKKPVSLNNSGYRVEFIQEGCGLVEGDEPIRAIVGFICWRASHSAVREAMVLLRNIKFPAAALYLDSLWPFPGKAIEAFAEMVNKIVVIEETETAVLSKMIREITGINPVTMAPPQGGSIKAEDLFEKEDWI
jgi:TPP-dependent indolepyruvate ferredoxin oxidoreductase alpha subunit